MSPTPWSSVSVHPPCAGSVEVAIPWAPSVATHSDVEGHDMSSRSLVTLSSVVVHALGPPSGSVEDSTRPLSPSFVTPTHSVTAGHDNAICPPPPPWLFQAA